MHKKILEIQMLPLRNMVGDFPTEMFEHFFQSLINAAALTCHIETKEKILIIYLKLHLKHLQGA